MKFGAAPPPVEYALTVISPDIWQILATIGTLAAVVVSVAFGVIEGVKSRRDRKELVEVRQEAIKKGAALEEQRRFAVARLVTAWVVDSYSADPHAEGYRRTLILHVANESDEPVVDATVNVYLGGRSRLIGPLAAPTPIPVIPPRREFTWDITTGVLAFDDNTNVLVGLGFTDAHSRRWHRELDGTLSESTGKDVFHYPEENPTAVEQQLGESDPWRNPMSIAFLFAQSLWIDPTDFNYDEFLPLLDPLASGWQGDWTKDRVEELRDLLSGYNNLAALAWYGAPKVAYARLFSDVALNQVTEAGTGLSMDARFITLVHRDQYGWRVFAVGSRFRPDQIHFPEFGNALGASEPNGDAAAKA